MSSSSPVVVIGTGPAGAAACVFLTRAGVTPLVLEAGSERTRLGLTARVRGVTIAKLKPPIQLRKDLRLGGDPRTQLFESLAPGGLSNHWACAVPRFAPDDFADAARAGQEYAWPVGYSDLVPWYERVEPILQIAGAEEDVPALARPNASKRWRLAPAWESVGREARRCGRDVVAMPYAFGADTTITRAATPANAYTRFIRPLAREGKLDIRYDTHAISLEWSPSQRRVTAVLCRNGRTNGVERIACRAVVLAAGAVNTAQLLLQSRSSDFPNGLGNSNGVLGRYLHDHPLAKLVLDLGRPVPITPASYITRPPLDRTSPLYAVAFMQWAGALALARTLLSRHPGTSTTVGFSMFGTMVPTADDRVELEGADVAAERAVLRLSLRYPRAAVAGLEHARDELNGILTHAGWEPRLRIFHVEPPGNSVHYGGTARMHASPKFGVVDAYSRVHEVPGVVVADSAVFTTGPEKNPVLTAMALAARASDRLATDIKSGDL